MNKALTLSLIFLTFFAFANQEQSFNDTANWAKQTSKSMLTPNNIPLNVNDYCKDATCQAQVANPNEKSLNDGNMEAKAAQAFASNDLAQGISKNTNKPRPDFKNDQKMRYALIGQENAFEISHDKSNKYVNCDNGNQCLFDDYEKVCHSPTKTPVPCYKTPQFIPDVIAVSWTCSSGTLEGTRCVTRRNECRLDASNFSSDTHTTTCNNNGERTTVWRWDGRNVSPSQGFWRGYFGGKSHSAWDCSRDRNGYSDTYSYAICTTLSYYHNATPVCPSGYTRVGYQCVKNALSWKKDCSLIKECAVVSERCVEGPGYRTINGVSTYLPCWKYEVLHECDLPDNCGQFSECRDGKRECSLKQNGVCIEEKVTKICTKKTCRTVTLNCGEQSFCLDGECYDSTPTLNGDFDKSAAALAALGEAAKGLGDPPKIFTGKPMQCSIKIGGIANCCKDGGWGTDIGLTSCDEDEKSLGRAKEKGLTLYIGEYCAEKVLGACIRKKRTYCAYDSKLGKIIQEQGAISQLGKTLGSAEEPTCAALTPEELGQINFDRIDFSEFYPELHSRINLPDPNVIKQRIQSSVAGDSN
ncbi:type-F conjugative transfer system mating-pair stabilization protein TraN [Vibrio tubiashii]|jgi:conjugal transfer mating pair stabilization protein TraN|uniref:Conjugal transfer mating pair stabilization protein TraN n=1 Tax=Vibrio tubiashii ATCC 19109 TaxID=1051646 RepID=F9T580_9VIBR|nr:type-F conjugative transfer system mating-pair stabilization protein TraN [Vibrio tubiashii]AIW17433.1 conjugal transfer protein TraN [Vibrio tubiashii ATCC 19109]EGU55277.1 conjugal transfer mating pair stabilization protein TraN [Vibrio tubiashii ATCC 19109]EIF04441.1 conjugal transfer mating pair stabilization protein TraN [Vibrio tubiashii NCIMB 1337 = ATCC 19106]